MRQFAASHCSVGLIAIVGLFGVLSGCASRGEGTLPGGGSYKWDNGANTWAVSVPANRCWEGRFFDGDGGQIGETVSGHGPDAGHMPQGTVSFKYKEVPCDDGGDEGGDVQGGHVPHPAGLDLFKYMSGTIVIDSAGSGSLFEQIDVLAFSADRADQKHANVIVGQSLPAETTVHALMAYDVSATAVVVESSLPSRFAEFTVEVNGTVVAERGNGVAMSGAGNGWITATTALPLAYFAPGNEVRISQRAALAPTGVSTALELTF